MSDDKPDVKKAKPDETAAATTTTTTTTTTPAVVPLDAETSRKVKQQVEFYFSDNNFVRDKFLRAEAAKRADGFIPIATLLTFNRLKALSNNPALVAEAISESDVVLLSDDKTSVKRRHALPGELNLIDFAIYTKPYPADVTFEQVSEFWAQHVGPVAASRLRRDPSHVFKGSVFVEFRSAADALLAVSKTTTGDGLSFAGQKLHAELKADYVKRKMIEHGADPNKPRTPRTPREKRDRPAASSASTAEGAEGAAAAAAASTDGTGAATTAAPSDELHFTPGCIVRIDGLGVIPDRDDLKAAFEPFGEIEYVDYTDQATSGFVRFSEPDAAQAALDAFAGGKREIFSKTPALSLVDGDAEREYWRAIVAHGKARSKGGRGRGRGGRRGGRGGGGRGGGGRGGQKRRRE